MTPNDHFIDIGIKLHIREWAGHNTPFVLLHGLSSNSRTWDQVAAQLAQAGHRVIAIDQRGHGLSDKPDQGYDFGTITADLAQLLEALELNRPVLVGQSWGGNVLLEFGARYPNRAAGLGFVDGGFIDLQSRPDATWETISAQLRPPSLSGTPRQIMQRRLAESHPEWTETGIEATLHNFEALPDGTVSPWLTLPRHMTILRAMWEQRPAHLFARVSEPVLVCVASDANNPSRMAVKAQQLTTLQALVPQNIVHWFENTDHDIHVHRPRALAELLIETLADGIWRSK